MLTHDNSGSSCGLKNGDIGGINCTYSGGLAGFSFVLSSMAEMAEMYIIIDLFKVTIEFNS